MTARSDAPVSRPRFADGQSAVDQFRQGLSAPLHALRYIAARPSMWKYSLLSGLVTIGIFAILATVGVVFSDDLLGLLWARPDAKLLVVLWWFVVALTGVVLLAAAFAVTLVLAGIVLAPFMDVLSERVETGILDNSVETKATAASLARDLGTGIAHPLFTLAVYAALMMPVLALNLVPVIGSMAAAGIGVALSAAMLSMEFTDQPQSRRRFKWREKATLVWEQRWTMFGLGVGVQLLMLVPVLDFFLLPIAVVAGTMVFCGLDESGRIRFVDRRRLTEVGSVATHPPVAARESNSPPTA